MRGMFPAEVAMNKMPERNAILLSPVLVQDSTCL